MKLILCSFHPRFHFFPKLEKEFAEINFTGVYRFKSGFLCKKLGVTLNSPAVVLGKTSLSFLGIFIEQHEKDEKKDY